jgi:pectin methylesterase-like acyl-CoA thioesterase
MRKSLLAVLAVALVAPAAANAQTYPEPKQPGPVESAPKGPHKTYTVCKSGCDFKAIQKAVDKARAGTRCGSRTARTARR